MSAEILIVGAGLAGCAIAAHVSRFASVLVLESSDRIAQEAAAQNAGLIRRLDPEPCDRALAQRTFEYLCDRNSNLSRRTGAVLGLVRDPSGLHDACAHLKARGITIDRADPNDFPLLEGAPLSRAWHLPEERVTDGPRLASSFLQDAQRQGAQLYTHRTVQSLILEQDRCVGVQTSEGPVYAEITIIACGAWSGFLAASAGLHRPLIPLRRMAALTPPIKGIGTDHPWCWLDDVGLYIKPESDGLLVSPCDERPDAPTLGRSSTGQPNAIQWRLLHDKVHAFLPILRDEPMVRSWTGLRTFCPDRRPMLGADGECRGLYWAAGLGGSGLSSCVGVGEALAAWIEGKDTPWLDPTGVAPNRHHLSRWPIYPEGDPSRARLIRGDSVLAL